jgi:hypothetical protein
VRDAARVAPGSGHGDRRRGAGWKPADGDCQCAVAGLRRRAMIAGAAARKERGDQQRGEGTTADKRRQVHGVSDWRSSDRLERGGKRGTVRSVAVSLQGPVSEEPLTAEYWIRGCPVLGATIKFASRSGAEAARGKDRNAPWCNWQHACLWSRRVLVRSQEGQLQRPHWLRLMWVLCIGSVDRAASPLRGALGSEPRSRRANGELSWRTLDD